MLWLMYVVFSSALLCIQKENYGSLLDVGGIIPIKFIYLFIKYWVFVLLKICTNIKFYWLELLRYHIFQEQ